ncbi:MAG: virulence RhuM family protein [Rhodocyclaceae bacterium]|nr:virulence RhuM family protein [Rhodocyclaceae bacterium]MCA3025681.1 virulence RhuM family protein [Rhodocyclaceae bacterium]MCA3033066.1 virulence RhuM family protein [Rhodocyclaceae bacterium]MCA3038410.1 virulence RhuM family protein [Rhodocyclaceae bacterium]MCA3041359.1 virulence RhuM family protein [Rhodocyclaceae bacterium]
MSTHEPGSPSGEIILYQTGDGHTRIECRFDGETVWLSQAMMSELFQTTPQNITLHLKSIYAEGELREEATCKPYLQVRLEGERTVQRQVRYYNLDMILAVGFRVRSARGTAFRQWATTRLKEYLVKGFVMDDERLKNPPGPGVPDYFDELLERIRDIRASEKRMYLKVRDIFALAADYQPAAAETVQFFQIIQNKLHWAITGKTAAELIADRADHKLPNMGLTTWKGSKVRRADVTIAKNYLRENEIAELNRIVVMYLDYAEDQAQRRKVLYMQDWRTKLDAFLQFNERDILSDAGRVAKTVADQLASTEYETFNARRLQHDTQAEADAFDNAIKQLPSKPIAAAPKKQMKPAPKDKKA